jgi:succinoglycan biosynthesis protein ExoM
MTGPVGARSEDHRAGPPGEVAISICVCTFRRPAGLLRLLRSLRSLDPATPAHEIIVVDNEAERTAAPTIAQARAEGLDVQYLVEPLRGIARARNRSLQPARGEYVAFIDDDEEADPKWLVEMWREVVQRGADGGIGPVIPRFSSGTPEWAIAGRFFERPRWPTGTVLRATLARTGNALLRREALMSRPGPFDERYDFTGGEDTDLFVRLVSGGCRLIAVDSALVYEHLTPTRTTASWLLRRRFLGALGTERLLKRNRGSVPARSWRGARSLGVALWWGSVGMLSFPVARIYAIDRLSVAARQLGLVASLCGISYRPYLNDSWR